MNLLNGSNTTNETTSPTSTSQYDCETPHLIVDFNEFVHCYQFFFVQSTFNSVCQLVIIVGTIFFNALLIALTLCHKGKRTAFDDILVGHAFVDGLTGIVDIPLFHINDRFGYWPLSPILGEFWQSYDCNINITTTLHMLYASYARWRSMKNPQGYKFELWLKRPYWVMAGFWVFGISVWAPIVFASGLNENSNAVNMNIYFNATINFATWFVPLMSILVICVFIYVELIRMVKRTQHLLCKNLPLWRRYRLAAQFRFIIIMGSYWVQWALPCFVSVTAPFLTGIPTYMLTNIYWLTYSVCLIDPLCVLALNTNISCSCFCGGGGSHAAGTHMATNKHKRRKTLMIVAPLKSLDMSQVAEKSTADQPTFKQSSTAQP